MILFYVPYVCNDNETRLDTIIDHLNKLLALLSKDRCLDCCIQFGITICLTNTCFDLFCFSSSTIHDNNRISLRRLFPFQVLIQHDS